eukprot:CAMPEP_0172617020 /NCGR_PEP_ID=MMETSP1068-20121228/69619_1 /TAXON_ID=35684 /ORGANISM="Pseudopedinella elastica, Strain CCMP716" /LENGTH=60 /DNA_ID=CAMNT_0013422665 /DNA_START=240 /DNA_END=419 /DNA_ORIENTATION=+
MCITLGLDSSILGLAVDSLPDAVTTPLGLPAPDWSAPYAVCITLGLDLDSLPDAVTSTLG